MRSKMRRVRARFRWYHSTVDARSTVREAIRQVYRLITPRGFAPRTPRHALSRAASSARSVPVGSLARSFAAIRDARSPVRDPHPGSLVWRYGSGGVTRLPLGCFGGFLRRRARLCRTFLPFLAFEARPEPRHQINDV